MWPTISVVSSTSNLHALFLLITFQAHSEQIPTSLRTCKEKLAAPTSVNMEIFLHKHPTRRRTKVTACRMKPQWLVGGEAAVEHEPKKNFFLGSWQTPTIYMTKLKLCGEKTLMVWQVVVHNCPSISPAML